MYVVESVWCGTTEIYSGYIPKTCALLICMAVLVYTMSVAKYTTSTQNASFVAFVLEKKLTMKNFKFFKLRTVKLSEGF